eukprot:8154914-Alexandrium_andersonii.AAC.1
MFVPWRHRHELNVARSQTSLPPHEAALGHLLAEEAHGEVIHVPIQPRVPHDINRDPLGTEVVCHSVRDPGIGFCDLPR